jgi:hypothetical protein
MIKMFLADYHKGFFTATTVETVSQFTYVENCVHGHLCLEEALERSPQRVAGKVHKRNTDSF